MHPASGAGGGYVAALSEEAALAVGQQIEISGLKTRAELNGKAAIVKDPRYCPVGIKA